MARNFCQSCGMPMDKDPNGGGTLADGKTSSEYCSFCFADGAFLWQGSDVRAYQKMVVEQMVKNGWWYPLAWFFTRQIPKLRRWKQT